MNNQLDDGINIATSELLTNIFQGSGDGMRIIDDDFTIINSNIEMDYLCGVPNEDTKGMKCYDQLCGEHCFSPTCTLREVLAGAERIQVETIKRSLDGKLIWVEMVATPLIQNGKVAGVIESFRDITLRKESEEKLILAQQESEAANQAKTEFLANMSHELYTPMNGIVGGTNLLLGTGLTKDQKNNLNMIKESSSNLMALLNNLMDYSKFSAGQIKLNLTDFNPKQLVGELCARIDKQLEAKPVVLICNGSDRLPNTINYDKDRFYQLLVSLLDNAATFTESGHIILDFDVEEERDNRLKIHIIVKDSGIGIEPDKLATIFEPLKQVDGSNTRKYGGIGLGLALCRKISELSQGEIWAKSDVGQGSEFHFAVWCKKAKSEKILQEGRTTDMGNQQESIEQSAPEKVSSWIKNILLVEDNHINQMVAKAVLGKIGYQVTVANDGQEAVDIFTDSPDDFDLIFMDLQMPVKDGFSASLEIREKGFTSVPIVALTANVLKSDQLRCYEVGMNDYITKPIKTDIIKNLIAHLEKGRVTIPIS